MSADVRLLHQAFFPEDELARFRRRLSGAGAIVDFTGIARPNSTGGQPVRALFLEHHPRLTLRSLQVIAQDATERFGLEAMLVVHRCGAILPSEPIVFVAAASAHRRAAFEATDYAMDRLKSEAIFWKREEHGAGWSWIEPTEGDARDLARWSR